MEDKEDQVILAVLAMADMEDPTEEEDLMTEEGIKKNTMTVAEKVDTVVVADINVKLKGL